MNLAEFKAWFYGYTEGMRDTPSAKQWARIKARVDEITAQPTEVRYFYDHYWRPYSYPYHMSSAGALTKTCIENKNAAAAYGAGCHSMGQITGSATANAFNSTDAFRLLGQADAHSEAA